MGWRETKKYLLANGAQILRSFIGKAVQVEGHRVRYGRLKRDWADGFRGVVREVRPAKNKVNGVEVVLVATVGGTRVASVRDIPAMMRAIEESQRTHFQKENHGRGV